jgi:hypothetical protein
MYAEFNLSRIRESVLASVFVTFGLAAAGAIAAQTCATCAENGTQTIAPFSKVFAALEHRPDYRLFVKAHYDTDARAYDLSYMGDDGIVRTVKVDAVRGEPLGQSVAERDF